MRKLKNEYNLLIEQLNQTKDEKTKLDLQKRIYKLKIKRIPLVESAYLEICDQATRQVYDDQLNLTIRIEGTKARVDRKITENPYEILLTSREICDDAKGDTRSIDRKLFRRKNALIKESEDKIKALQKDLDSLEGRKDAESYRKKSGIDGKIAMLEEEIERVKNAYNKVATKELRKAYDTELDKLERQANERIDENEKENEQNVVTENIEESTTPNFSKNYENIQKLEIDLENVNLEIKKGDSFKIEGMNLSDNIQIQENGENIKIVDETIAEKDKEVMTV